MRHLLYEEHWVGAAALKKSTCSEGCELLKCPVLLQISLIILKSFTISVSVDWFYCTLDKGPRFVSGTKVECTLPGARGRGEEGVI